MEDKKNKVKEIDKENKILLKQIQDLRFKYEKQNKNVNKKNLNKGKDENEIENWEEM